MKNPSNIELIILCTIYTTKKELLFFLIFKINQVGEFEIFYEKDSNWDCLILLD